MDLPFALVDGVPVFVGLEDAQLVGISVPDGDVAMFDAGEVTGFVSIDPAAVFYGAVMERQGEMQQAAAAPKRRAGRFQPRGQLFTPLPKGEVSGFPSSVLLGHRTETPSLDTVRLSSLFAVSTVRTSIEQAEKSFSCFVEMYEARGRALPTVEEIKRCFRGLQNTKSKMFSEVAAYAPVIQQAIKSGLRDRDLRRHLVRETDLPTGLGVTKVSFTLALLGHDCVCLDGRLLNRMFQPRDRALEIEAGWGKTGKHLSELALSRYEAVEDAFLEGNRHYNARDPLGRARAQWRSWESVGGKGATHSVWLKVVTKPGLHAVSAPTTSAPTTDWESIWAKNGLPPAPGQILKARWIAGNDDWWVKTDSGWYWLRNKKVWVPAPAGPPGENARAPTVQAPTARETDLSDFLAPMGMVEQIGPETETSWLPVTTRHGLKGIIRRYDSPHGSVRYVMLEDGRPVGALQVVTIDFKNAIIANVYVLPDKRRAGVAEALLVRAREDFQHVRHAQDLSSDATSWKRAVGEAAARPIGPPPPDHCLIQQATHRGVTYKVFQEYGEAGCSLLIEGSERNGQQGWHQDGFSSPEEAARVALETIDAHPDYYGVQAGGVATEAPSHYRGWDKRRERDEAVRANLNPDLLPLWDRVGKGFKGTPHQRYEAFMRYVHDHPDEVTQAQQGESSARVRQLIDQRQQQEERSERSVPFAPLREAPRRAPSRRIGSIEWRWEREGLYRAFVRGESTEWLASRNDNEPASSSLRWVLLYGNEVGPRAESYSLEDISGKLERMLARGAQAPVRDTRREGRGAGQPPTNLALDEVAAVFLAAVESQSQVFWRDYLDDPRVRKIAAGLVQVEAPPSIGPVLGSGSYGTAVALPDGRVLKLTSDTTETQAAYWLRQKNLPHVVRIDAAWFIRGVRAKAIIAVNQDNQPIRFQRGAVGIVLMERLTPLPRGPSRQGLTKTVFTFKDYYKLHPDQIKKMGPSRARIALQEASEKLEAVLRDNAQYLATKDDAAGAALASGVADGLAETRAVGVYAIDVHGGNVGTDGAGTYKIFDLGTSSSPPGAAPPLVAGPEAEPEPEDAQLSIPGMLSEAIIEDPDDPVPWVGEGRDALERAP